ncbi:MAG: cytochrome c biogenesis protein CcdA [Chloroflexi bacterium]|nr:cytochrome c biogenesis protein CcdA [Chloroflexota bacterium]
MPELSLAAALLAGLLSFLSPCVLPVVPAYLGALGAASAGAVAIGNRGQASDGIAPGGAIAVAGRPAGGGSLAVLAGARWTALTHAVAFVIGFGGVFTLLGVTATYAGGVLASGLPLLRQAGGVVLVILGLNLAGVLPIGILAQTWRPLQPAGPAPLRPVGARPLGRPSPAPFPMLDAFGLGAIFGLGWTPCIGPTLGAILGLAAIGPSLQVGLLFVAYSIGLGIPFVLLAVAFERVPGIVRALRVHARAFELAGGGLVVVIGLSLIFDWLSWFSARFSYLTPHV